MINKSNEKKLPRKERERQLHQQEILEAAERVFVRKGYHFATVDEIADEAEFAVGTIYNFFDSKEELYLNVVEKLAREFMELFEPAVLSKSNADEAIGALIELRLSHFEDHRGFFRVFFETSPGTRLDPARALPKDCANLYDNYISIVNDIFAKGINEGRFENLDPLYLTLCLEGVINAFVSYWSRREPAEPLEVRIDKLKNVFLGRICPSASQVEK